MKNKIKYIILSFFISSCYIDEIPGIYYAGYCDCIYYNEDYEEFEKILLRPGTYSIGWITLTRKQYCEEVMLGQLANCKSE